MPRALVPQKPKVSWRLWLRVIAWAALAAGVAFGARQVDSFLLQDPRFGLENLEIRGAVYANRARLQGVFEFDREKSVFSVPLAERRRHLLAVDWVSAATVTRVWPNKIVVTVTERRPAAFAKLPIGAVLTGSSARYRMALIDSEGVLLTIPPRVRFHLPVLSGITEEQPEADRKMRVKTMQHLLDDLGPQAKEISEVNAANLQDLRLITTIGGRAVELWIGDQHFRSRYQLFQSHYTEMRAHSDEANIFDLRMDDRILAR
ncbi:MAG TPA: FtsQ-type POTRA domain-containing protein [Bryobacteraceae bacterium]|jgi:cell division protein FtsQ|nr:FtsQ-type POTRA domain-containing protein [Bryobacteraceae bacterium]